MRVRPRRWLLALTLLPVLLVRGTAEATPPGGGGAESSAPPSATVVVALPASKKPGKAPPKTETTLGKKPHEKCLAPLRAAWDKKRAEIEASMPDGPARDLKLAEQKRLTVGGAAVAAAGCKDLE
ncbi:MAG: hypothetical protein JNL79_36780 [Myxococcales bacterium]|nr:hypothetical protein [Myxococcales bacterium]